MCKNVTFNDFIKPIDATTATYLKQVMAVRPWVKNDYEIIKSWNYNKKWMRPPYSHHYEGY